jgi:hypothetical protein
MAFEQFGYRSCSDGSFSTGIGTAAVTFWDGKSIQFFAMAIPGLPEDQTPYRSELGGCYGQLWFWVYFCEYHQRHNLTIDIICDGQSALDAIFGPPVTVHQPQRDILSGCQSAIQRGLQIGLVFKPVHTYGHQDNNKWNILGLEATLNCEADAQAVAYRLNLVSHEHHAKAHRIHGERWTLVINGERTIRNQRHRMKESVTWQPLHNHMLQKRAERMDLNEMAYEPLEHAMEQLTPTRRRWVTKHVHRFGPVGYNLFRRKEWASPTCPLCPNVEYSFHEWTCPSEFQVTFRQQRMVDLAEWLSQYPTDPDIAKAIIQRLSEWLESQPHAPLTGIHRDIQAALVKQDDIGWDLPFTGMWHRDWIAVQQQYLQFKGSKRTAKLWLSALIRQTLQLAFDLWERRNQVVHETVHQKQQLSIRRHIQWIYAQDRSSFPPHAQARLTNLQELLNKPPAQQKAWLLAFEAYCKSDFTKLDKHHSRVARSIGHQPILQRTRLPAPSNTQVLTALRRYRQNPGQTRLSLRPQSLQKS